MRILQVKSEDTIGLTSVKVISKKYILNERFLHVHERTLFPVLHNLTGLLRIFCINFDVCAQKEKEYCQEVSLIIQSKLIPHVL